MGSSNECLENKIERIEQSLESSESSDFSSDSENENETIVFKRKRKLSEDPPLANKVNKTREILAAELEFDNRYSSTPTKENENLVDDTDNLDPDLEYEQWETRERSRLKREHEYLMSLERDEMEKLERREKRLGRT